MEPAWCTWEREYQPNKRGSRLGLLSFPGRIEKTKARFPTDYRSRAWGKQKWKEFFAKPLGLWARCRTQFHQAQAVLKANLISKTKDKFHSLWTGATAIYLPRRMKQESTTSITCLLDSATATHTGILSKMKLCKFSRGYYAHLFSSASDPLSSSMTWTCICFQHVKW